MKYTKIKDCEVISLSDNVYAKIFWQLLSQNRYL
jgi:hypothetical protein